MVTISDLGDGLCLVPDLELLLRTLLSGEDYMQSTDEIHGRRHKEEISRRGIEFWRM